ncbi:hypothetical protein AB4259_15710 [Vibrio amylolyticus]|uniref:hypothetical protein n=1 Tax=Vibrio TaxID=662 RepID=UPI000C848DD6|nr:hypothetical protein [Vibrio sp. 10N.261.55.A7]PMJ92653.1 hypothetical protein BCU12_07265 [Vibrio sp. 10N.261.55.A7]
MTIHIDKNGIKGIIKLEEKVVGRGVVNHNSWMLYSTSSSLILEISDDPEITPEDLPLVGFGCGGWIVEEKCQWQSCNLEEFVEEAMKQFKANTLPYTPAVSCPCSE